MLSNVQNFCLWLTPSSQLSLPNLTFFLPSLPLKILGKDFSHCQTVEICRLPEDQDSDECPYLISPSSNKEMIDGQLLKFQDYLRVLFCRTPRGFILTSGLRFSLIRISWGRCVSSFSHSDSPVWVSLLAKFWPQICYVPFGSRSLHFTLWWTQSDT